MTIKRTARSAGLSARRLAFQGRIASTNDEIYSSTEAGEKTPDGDAGVNNLTNNAAVDTSPAWSPRP